MKKPSYIPVLILTGALVLIGLADMAENFVWQTKLGFLGKIFLIIGVLSLWAMTLNPLWNNNKEDGGR